MGIVALADKMLSINGKVCDTIESAADILGLVEAAQTQTLGVQGNRDQYINVFQQRRPYVVACRLPPQGIEYLRLRVKSELPMLYQTTDYGSAPAIVVGKSGSTLVTDYVCLGRDEVGKEHVYAVVVYGRMFGAGQGVQTLAAYHLFGRE